LVQAPGGQIVLSVIDAASPLNVSLDLRHVEDAISKQEVQPRLEKLTPRQTGDDVLDALFVRETHAQGVEGYRDTFAGFIGKSADENVAEYKKRSPYALASKLETPLLIHSTTNDEDVNVIEVEHLIDSLKAAGKKFEYRIYDNAPGGHYFNRIDTPLAKESRKDILAFLAKYLK
jgi:acetyl esterase/lipase